MKSLSDIKKIARETIAIELAAVAKLESSINDDFVNEDMHDHFNRKDKTNT